jgi:AcrR family transcriptional regulator
MTRAPDAYSEARIEEIRDAAIRVFARKGLEHARMQDIADEAGLSAGALYRYFEGKDALIRRVFESAEAENRQLFEQARAASGSPLEALIATGAAAWSCFGDDDVREHFILTLETALAAARGAGGVGPELGEHLADVVAELETLIREAQSAGEIASDIDARALATLLLATHQGLGVLIVGHAPANTAGTEAFDAGAVLALLTRMLQAIAPQGEG